MHLRLTQPIQLQEYNKPSPNTIAFKPPEEAHKTLGVWKTMDGNLQQQIAVLTQRSKNLSNFVATSGVYPYQDDVGIPMIYTPAMCYSLPAVSISEAALDKIQYKALETFVPVSGFNKGTPRAMILGPIAYGDTITSLRHYKISWPRQQRPKCDDSLKVWKKCIQVCFLQGRSRHLARPLGRWVVHPKGSESFWPAYIHNNYQSTIQRIGNTIVKYSNIHRTTSCTTTFTTDIIECLDQIPDYYIPVNIRILDQQIIASHYKQRTIASATTLYNPQPDLTQSIQESPIWKTHILQHFHVPNTDAFLSILQDTQKTLIVVSDGGLHDGKGSFGVSIGLIAEDLVSIDGPAPGNTFLLTSLRSEPYGLLAAIEFINHYIITYEIIIPPNRVLQLYTDNLGLVCWIEEILANICYARMYIRSEADVILQIQHEISVAKIFNFCLKIENVKGHQDKFCPYNELSRQAQLNLRADSFATNYLHHGTGHQYEELCKNPVS